MDKNKLLYFDDEPFITGPLARNLEMAGWNVTMVSEIDDLFKELRTRKFNILILDIMAPIPDMHNRYINFSAQEIDEMSIGEDNKGINSGVVIAKKVWREFDMEIPILFLSARRNPILEDKELKNYRCDYLKKPQRSAAVDKKLLDMLNKQINPNDHE